MTAKQQEQMPELLPCPFCGGGNTQIDECKTPPSMSGKSTVISATVRHWCPKEDGQPHGLHVSKIGRDRESAIAAWNTRALTPESEGIAGKK